MTIVDKLRAADAHLWPYAHRTTILAAADRIEQLERRLLAEEWRRGRWLGCTTRQTI